jgi:hypothetical protein
MPQPRRRLFPASPPSKWPHGRDTGRPLVALSAGPDSVAGQHDVWFVRRRRCTQRYEICRRERRSHSERWWRENCMNNWALRGATCVGASALHALAVASSHAAAVFYSRQETRRRPVWEVKCATRRAFALLCSLRRPQPLRRRSSAFRSFDLRQSPFWQDELHCLQSMYLQA